MQFSLLNLINFRYIESPMNTTNSIKIKCAEIELLDNGIVQLKYQHDYEVELEDVKEVEKVFIQLSEGGAIFCLMDTSGRFNIYSNEAQKFLSKEASIVREEKIKASAVVIDNLANRMIARFFSKFFKPKFAMKIFSNRENAILWLEEKMNKR